MSDKEMLNVETFRAHISAITAAFEDNPQAFVDTANKTIELIKKDKAQSKNPLVHVTEHLNNVMPELARDEAIASFASRANLPSGLEPPTVTASAGAAIAAGILIVVVGAGVGAVYYCLGTNEDGTVHHIPILC
ncbi:hypothetical protein ACLE20_04770 [Rhizobium sp. YIM 134829]|uniref:hypothetical protein n=1 Tax=Rhizobium sp. YIM 134829 TaxID=3390453 RepID=UPI003978EB47